MDYERSKRESLQRQKKMGLFLVFFALLSLLYSFNLKSEDMVSSMRAMAGLFAALGVYTLGTLWQKKTFNKM